MHLYIIYMRIYSEMNDNNDTRDRSEELELSYYYKVFTLHPRNGVI